METGGRASYLSVMKEAKKIKLLAAIEKELASARKDFYSASDVMDRTRDTPLRDLSEKQKKDFCRANVMYQSSDKVLTALYAAKKAIESI